MDVLPATLNVKVAPFQKLFFNSATHTADERGIILDVPYDTARALIDADDHPATEATEADLAPVLIAESAPVAKEPKAADTKPAAKTADTKTSTAE